LVLDVADWPQTLLPNIRNLPMAKQGMMATSEGHESYLIL
jgi:hypothetical protein